MKCAIIATLIFYNLIAFQVKAHEMPLYDHMIPLVTDVKQFYKSSSVYCIYSKNDRDLAYQRLLVEDIIDFSRNYVMSQMLSFSKLVTAMDRNILIGKTGSTAPLFTVSIQDDQSLQSFQRIVKYWDMSTRVWFMFIHNKTTIDCERPYGNMFNLKMDTRMIVKCESNNKIMKYYSIDRKSTEVADLGTWTPETKLVFNSDDLVLQVKKNMKGITLRLAMPLESVNNTNHPISHFLLTIIDILKGISNFTTEISAEDNEIGYRNLTVNKWSGLMRYMVEGKTDILVAMISMSNYRLKFVDFLVPLYRARCKLYMRVPDTVTIRWSAYFKVFDSYTWLTIGCAILILSVLLGITKSYVQMRYFHMGYFFENLIKVLGIYCQQGLSERPRNKPTQILYFSILISSVILYAIYSAMITSYITVLQNDLPFSNYQEFLKSKNYKVLIIRGSRDEQLIHTGDWLLSPMKNKLKREELLPTDVFDGFQHICADEKVAFYANDFFFETLDKKNLCSVDSLNLPRVEYQTIALLKNSPYSKTMNYYMLRLMDHGIITRLKRKYFYQDTIVFRSPPNVMTFWEVVPILSIWTAGLISSLLIFCLELLCKRQRFFGRRR